MMRPFTQVGLFFILLLGACVDRVNLDLPPPDRYPVAIDGMISDQPGPYQVIVTRAQDIESKDSPRIRIPVKWMILSDDAGNKDTLTLTKYNFYQTSTSMRGQVGRVYTLYFKLLDGREYLSRPDTLLPTGQVKDVSFSFRSDPAGPYTTKYGFDIFFDASTQGLRNNQFLWKMVGTYKADITCCTCWVFINNPIPIVSDGQLVEGGEFKHVKAGYIPVNAYTFMNKVYAGVQQMSLTQGAFRFWRAVQSQQQSIGSLFQPSFGKIPENFTQLSGEPGEVFGLFYATSITTNGVFITRQDVPNQSFIPDPSPAPTNGNYIPPASCIEAFPGSTDIRPPYWED